MDLLYYFKISVLTARILSQRLRKYIVQRGETLASDTRIIYVARTSNAVPELH